MTPLFPALVRILACWVSLLPVVSAAVSHVSSLTAQNRLAARLCFEPNVGQTKAAVSFLARGPGYQLLCAPSEVLLVLNQSQDTPAPAVLRVEVLGASGPAVLNPRQPLPGRVNYLRGNDPSQWHYGIPTYERICQENIYPDVDLVYYGNENQLEYDFIVQPGGNPADIRLAFEGADEMHLDGFGDLVVRVGAGEVRHHKPIVYQVINGRRVARAGEFLLSGREVTFRVAEYERSAPLIIDPVLEYASYFGGFFKDRGLGIAVDQDGNAIVCGEASLQFPTTNAVQSAFGGVRLSDLYYGDAIVVKFNSNATQMVYATYLGGSDDDRAYGVVADADGYAYVVGETSSGNFPTKNALWSTGMGGFLTRLDPEGKLDFSTYLDDDGSTPLGVALDKEANIYLTGFTSSTNLPAVQAFQSTNAGAIDAFVMKLDRFGQNILLSSYFGGAQVDVANAIAVSSTGSFAIAGRSSSEDFTFTPDRYEALPVRNPFQATRAGAQDAFVAKFGSSGELLFSSYLGGNRDDRADSVAIDPALNIYLAGETQSTNFPVSNPWHEQLASAPGGVASVGGFVTKIDLGGAIVYST